VSALDLRTIARRLGGEVQGRAVLAPGPDHSPGDRSLSVRLSHQSPTGFIVHSHSGDDFRVSRDYVSAKLGLGPDAWRTRRPTLYNVQDRTAAWSGSTSCILSTRLDPDRAARIARAIAIWNASGDAHGSIVEMYLAGRGLELPPGADALRYHARTPWREDDGSVIFVGCMIAAMRAIDGDAITSIHRTRLTPDGTKIGRRMLGIVAGAAIKLDADGDVTHGLHVGEGAETCMAARELGLRPCWALGSAGAIAVFPVLPGVECLTILAERDDANRRAVDTCGARWHAAGREVVVVEPASGSDILDALRGAA